MSPKRVGADLLREYLNLGVGIILAVVIGFISIRKFTQLFQQNVSQAYLSISLLVVTCIFVLGWLYFDYQEVLLYDEYMNGDNLVKLDLAPFLFTLIFGAFLGFLVTITDDLYLYLPLIILTLIVSAFANAYIRKKLLTAYEKLPKDLDSPKKQICTMFKIRPFVHLDGIATFLIVIAYVMLWHEKFTGQNFYLIIAYTIPCFTILIHEILVWIWRSKRNRRIKELEKLGMTSSSRPRKSNSKKSSIS